MIFSENLKQGRVIEMESGGPLFRLDSYEKNPVVTPQDIGLTWKENDELKIGAVFNGGAEIFEDKVILVPRCHQNYTKIKVFDEKLGIEKNCLENYTSEVWPLISDDGIRFRRHRNGAIRADGSQHKDFTYGIEDLRIIKQGNRYLLIGCGKTKPPFKGSNADRIAVYSTENFVNITYHGMVEPFDSRNAVVFPEPIADKYWMLFRFYPNIHIDFLEAGMDQLLNPSKYKENWKKKFEQRAQTLLLKSGDFLHEKEKIGPGPQLIKTKQGWLFIYHAVGDIEDDICKIYSLEKKIERGYSICAALLDLDNPKKVICRTKKPIYIPSFPYELYGNEQYPVDVPAVVFPVGAIIQGDKLIIYAGAADKYTILLSCSLDKLLSYLLKYCKL